jgi:hypothetical protein
MSRQRRLAAIALITCGLTLVTLTTDVNAQVSKAFRISGSGSAPTGVPLPGQPPRPHMIIGQATHLGRHYGEGEVETISADFSQFPNTISGIFRSGIPFEFTGANGDKLVCDYGRDANGDAIGTLTLDILDILPGGDLVVQAEWIADFVARGDLSTGKFDGISGSWTMIANSEPFILGSSDPMFYSWSGKGRLTFQK